MNILKFIILVLFIFSFVKEILGRSLILDRSKSLFSKKLDFGKVPSKNFCKKEILLANLRDNYSKDEMNFEYQKNRYNSRFQNKDLNPLIRQASTASVAVLFVLLIWRSMSIYELADQAQSFRPLYVIPAFIILISNILGFLLNIIKPLNFKNHLKFILAVNIVREWIELLVNIVHIVLPRSFFRSEEFSRDVYLGRLFVNLWWSFLCFSFSKSRWVLQI